VTIRRRHSGKGGPDRPTLSIGRAAPRRMLATTGQIVTARMAWWGADRVFECCLEDDTGQLILVFFRGRPIPWAPSRLLRLGTGSDT
jgi:hypothetical protein